MELLLLGCSMRSKKGIAIDDFMPILVGACFFMGLFIVLLFVSKQQEKSAVHDIQMAYAEQMVRAVSVDYLRETIDDLDKQMTMLEFIQRSQGQDALARMDRFSQTTQRFIRHRFSNLGGLWYVRIFDGSGTLGTIGGYYAAGDVSCLGKKSRVVSSTPIVTYSEKVVTLEFCLIAESVRGAV